MASDSFEPIYTALNHRFQTFGFDEGHQLSHALTVASHAYLALQDFPNLTLEQKDAVLIACLLHDINDHKFIQEEKHILSVDTLLRDYVSSSCILMVGFMIEVISCSKHGDSVITPNWMAIPRYADRLEAMGEIGLQRAISYAEHMGRPFINDQTLVPMSESDLDRIASQDRYIEYTTGRRNSLTTMDHLYDKILHLSVPSWVESPTLTQIAEKRKCWLRNYILNWFRNRISNKCISLDSRERHFDIIAEK